MDQAVRFDSTESSRPAYVPPMPANWPSMADKVQQHYGQLAAQFTALSNPYCFARYRRGIERRLRPEDSVLDIGCGTGLLLSMFTARRRTGCDLSPELLRQIRPAGVELVQADAERLPFDGAIFDLVYSINLLEHVPQPGRVVREALRVLKPAGTLLLVTPNGDLAWFLELADRLKLKVPEGPHRFLTNRELRDILREAGADVTACGKMVLFPKGPAWSLTFLERVERVLPGLGFFHVVEARKPAAG